jgi:hypothetical protein
MHAPARRISGEVFVALGFMCVLGGSMVPTVNPSAANAVLWTGIVMILAGWLMGYLGRRKNLIVRRVGEVQTSKKNSLHKQIVPTQKRAEREGLTVAKIWIDDGKPGVF